MALIEWMERHDPEADAPIEGTAVEVFDFLALGDGED
jgi:hypothetical protein